MGGTAHRGVTAIVGMLMVVGTATVGTCTDPCGIGSEACYETYRDAASTLFNEAVNVNAVPDNGQGVWWSKPFVQSQSRYVRFVFDQIISPRGARYRVRVVRLPAEEEISSYDASEFASESTFMTGLLPSGSLRVELLADQRPAGLSFTLHHALSQAPSNAPTPRTPVYLFKAMAALPANDPIAKLEPAIAKLHIGAAETSCTGILVRPGRVLTNYHCMLHSLSFLKSEQSVHPSCKDVVLEFDYLAPKQVGKTTTCLAVRVDKSLDAAVLTIDPVPTADGQAREPIKLREDEEKAPTPLVLIHHPYGAPMAYQRCEASRIDGSDVLHDCLTISGSSGSALLDDQMRLFALHYKGAYPNDWSNAQMEQDFNDNGTRFNKGRAAGALTTFLETEPH